MAQSPGNACLSASSLLILRPHLTPGDQPRTLRDTSYLRPRHCKAAYSPPLQHQTCRQRPWRRSPTLSSTVWQGTDPVTSSRTTLTRFPYQTFCAICSAQALGFEFSSWPRWALDSRSPPCVCCSQNSSSKTTCAYTRRGPLLSAGSLSAVLQNPTRYGSLVDRLVVRDPTHFEEFERPTRESSPLLQFDGSDDELDNQAQGPIRPLDTDKIQQLLRCCPGLTEVIWLSATPPPDGFCEVRRS